MPDGSYVHPQERQFNPYTENGGTILAIAGADFSVIAGDTRQSEGYSIQTRYAPKVFRLYVRACRYGELLPTLLPQNRQGCPRRKWLRGRREHVREEGEATAGGTCSLLLIAPAVLCSPRPQWYRHAHAKDMPLRAIARLIQTMLYAQRFFPYYVYNILGGIEEDGTRHPPSPAFSDRCSPLP